MTMRLAPWLALVLTSCSAGSTFRPSLVAARELTLSARSGLAVHAGSQERPGAPEPVDLYDAVWCVPEAQRHAEAARSTQKEVARLQGVSFVSYFAGLTGLAGLAFRGRDDTLMASLLISGAVLELLSIATGASAYVLKGHVDGHTVDAVNYYNDALGFSGGSCPASSAAERPSRGP